MLYYNSHCVSLYWHIVIVLQQATVFKVTHDFSFIFSKLTRKHKKYACVQKKKIVRKQFRKYSQTWREKDWWHALKANTLFAFVLSSYMHAMVDSSIQAKQHPTQQPHILLERKSFSSVLFKHSCGYHVSTVVTVFIRVYMWEVYYACIANDNTLFLALYK